MEVPIASLKGNGFGEHFELYLNPFPPECCLDTLHTLHNSAQFEYQFCYFVHLYSQQRNYPTSHSYRVRKTLLLLAPPQLLCTQHIRIYPLCTSPSSLKIYSIPLFSDATQVKCYFNWDLTSEVPLPTQSISDSPFHTSLPRQEHQ